jgi:hypothetical protein
MAYTTLGPTVVDLSISSMISRTSYLPAKQVKWCTHGHYGPHDEQRVIPHYKPRVNNNGGGINRVSNHGHYGPHDEPRVRPHDEPRVNNNGGGINCGSIHGHYGPHDEPRVRPHDEPQG